MIPCRHCGKPEGAPAHHAFEPGWEMPEGCVCPPGSWVSQPRPICEAHIGWKDRGCDRCLHDLGCHPQRKRAEICPECKTWAGICLHMGQPHHATV